jgi:hypothetical protein
VINLTALSRRALLESGSGALLAMSVASMPVSAARTGALSISNEQLLRKYYAAWSQHDWSLVRAFLDDGFSFTSAAGDDHIPLSAFKAQCWDTQSPYIERFELLRVLAADKDAFVIYDCHMKNEKTFRNVEYLQIKEARLASITCYFGAAAGYPTAVGVK